MPEGVIVHREQIIGTGTWSPRPAALAGIMPVAVYVYGDASAPAADGVIANDATPCWGFSDGTDAQARATIAVDGLTSTSTRVYTSASDLLYAGLVDQTVVLHVDPPSFVSGGFDANIAVNTNNPYITIVFFYGDDWVAKVGKERQPTTIGGTVTATTGFVGTHDNQIVLASAFAQDNAPNAPSTVQSAALSLGVAVRQGASVVPIDQIALSFASRAGRSTSELFTTFQAGRSHTVAYVNNLATAAEATAIRDNEIEFTTRDANQTERDIGFLAISTGTKKCWCGEVAAPIANGALAVTTGFQPIMAALVVSQNQTDGHENSDVACGGMALGDGSGEYSHSWSDLDASANSVCKRVRSNSFIEFLQSDGTDGWVAPTGNFSLTATGFQVENIVVDGGGGGAPLTARKWFAWAVEGEAGPPPAIVGTGALQAQNAAVVGVGEVIAAPVITGTGALQAQDAAVVGVGEVFGIVTGTGALQAQDATVVGVGDVAGAAIGTGTLQAQNAQVSGVGAVVHAGSGTLQAQDAAVIGVGEVGNVRTGAGALQADGAAVVGTGTRVSVGSGALQAQDAAVTGAGVVEGLASGTGVLQAQSAAVVGTGHLIRVGSGALQAQAAQVTGVGAILGDITLSPADIAAIADAVYAKLVSEGLVQQINEVWQRRGLDSANPQTYDKAGNQIRVGNITIDLSGDPSSVTQTRQP